jgi:hypothetical protein
MSFPPLVGEAFFGEGNPFLPFCLSAFSAKK